MLNLPGKYNKSKCVYVLCVYPNVPSKYIKQKFLKKAKYTKSRPIDNYSGRI